MTPRTFFKILLLLFFCTSVRGQQFPLRHLTVEEGLGHSIIYRTFQSRDGYLWFSTDNGITRYDGATFRNFTSEDGLPTNFIFDVVEYDNKLFICTLGGGIITLTGDKFNPAFDSSYNAPQHPVELVANHNGFLALDRFKKLYILQNNKFDSVTSTHLGVPHEGHAEFYHIEPDEKSFYIGTNLGMFLLENNAFRKIDLRLPKKSNVYRIRKIGTQRFLIVMDQYLLDYDLLTHTYDILLSNKSFSRFSRLLYDGEGNIWVSNVDGKLFMIKKTRSGHSSLQVLDDIVLNHIFQDRENNIWLSTYGEGAWFIQSTHLRNFPIKGNIVSDLSFDRSTNNLLVSTINSGIKIFRQEETGFLTPVTDTQVQNYFSNRPFLVASYFLPDGSLLVSSGHSVFRWKKDGLDSLQTTHPIVALYYQENKKKIWIGHRFFFSHADVNLQNHTPVPGFDKNVVRAIIEDFDGNILIGTDRGVFRETMNGFVPLKGKAKVINAMYRDNINKRIWVGTNNGLGYLDQDEIESAGSELTNTRCNSITGDEHGNLFVATVNGLLYYSKGKFDLISTKEGIAQSNILKISYDPGNRIIALLSPNSLSLLDSENFLQFSSFDLPDLLIEEISSPDERITLLDGKPVVFKSDIKQLTIHVSTPLIQNRDKLRYSYRINDKDWQEFNGRELVLHSFPLGNLIISLKAQKISQPNEAKIKVLEIVIPPPFYLRWWFITILLLLVIASVVLLVFTYSRNKNRKLLEENKRLDVEHKALRNLLNPHFLSNAINSIHAFILQNEQRQTLAYLSKFSQLVRLNLDLLSSDHTTLDKEVKNISLYLEFEKLRFADKLNYRIDIDPSISQSDIIVPSFIIQPFVENAIWHGLLPREEGGFLDLRIKQTDHKLQISIEDDGIGIYESLRHPKPEIDKKTSMGIHILKERFELLRKVSADYQLSIRDKKELTDEATGTGTLISITIPVADVGAESA
jgi:hypothetical protein